MAEGWGYLPVSRMDENGLEITHTYPDGGHGSFVMKGVPDGSGLVTFPLVEGAWIAPEDSGKVVLNHFAATLYPGIHVGDSLELTVNGETRVWLLKGIVREFAPAAAYVSEKSFDTLVKSPGQVQSLRVVANPMTPEARGKLVNQIENALQSSGYSVALVLSDIEFQNAIMEHVFVLIFVLIALAVLMSVVGSLGLASAIGVSVVERTREIGVMASIGGTPGIIIRNIISESLLIGLLSLGFSMLLSLPLTHFMAEVLGKMAFKTALSMAVSPQGFWIWSALMILGSVISSAYPAWRASRMSIRDTLAYE